MLMNANPVTGIVYVSDLTLTKGNIYFITMESSGDWNTYISGSGGLIPMLNKRLYLIKRLKNHLNDKNIQKVAESIYMSKVMYGLQSLGKIRWSESDTQTCHLKNLQKAQKN